MHAPVFRLVVEHLFSGRCLERVAASGNLHCCLRNWVKADGIWRIIYIYSTCTRVCTKKHWKINSYRRTSMLDKRLSRSVGRNATRVWQDRRSQLAIHRTGTAGSKWQTRSARNDRRRMLCTRSPAQHRCTASVCERKTRVKSSCKSQNLSNTWKIKKMKNDTVYIMKPLSPVDVALMANSLRPGTDVSSHGQPLNA